jgi:hypothetical protein
MNEPVETFERAGLTVQILPDDDPFDPRTENDNVAVMTCFHPRHTRLGDRHRFGDGVDLIRSLIGDEAMDGFEADFGKRLDAAKSDGERRAARGGFVQAIEAAAAERVAVFLPLYLYEHGGITISTKPFSCPWDSGRVGFVHVTRERAREEWGDGPDAVESARECALAEVAEYDNFITGQAYGYRLLDADGAAVEESWGLLGLADARTAASEAADLAAAAARSAAAGP